MSLWESELFIPVPSAPPQAKTYADSVGGLLFQSLELLGNKVLHMLDVHASPALQGSHIRSPLLALTYEKPLPSLSSHRSKRKDKELVTVSEG